MGYTVIVVVLVVVTGLLLGTAAYALWLGLLGTLTRERFVRCPYCHRRGLTRDGRFHDDGCSPTLGQRLEEVLEHIQHSDPRLRHHYLRHH